MFIPLYLMLQSLWTKQSIFQMMGVKLFPHPTLQGILIVYYWMHLAVHWVSGLNQ